MKSPNSVKSTTLAGKKPTALSVGASPALLPTPPKSSTGLSSRRSSPRGSTSSVSSPRERSVQGSPRVEMTTGNIKTSAKTSPSTKKRKTVKPLASEDLLCPICDDICTCVASADVSSGHAASGWSSPIIIKDKTVAVATKKKGKKESTVVVKRKGSSASVKADKKSSAHERRLDRRADTMAQLVLSEFYFDDLQDDMAEYDDSHEMSTCSDDEAALAGYELSSAFETEDEDAELEAIIFQLSEDSSEDEETTRRMKELVISKVNRVLGPNAARLVSSSDDEAEESICGWHLFDPAAPMNLPVPPPPPPTPVEGDAHLANLTPQVLAAISVAAKTLNEATQHYTANPDVPYVRAESAKPKLAFVYEVQSEPKAVGPSLAIEEVIDTSVLHGSSPPVGSLSAAPVPMRRWDKIPVNSFRKRRLSVPRNVLPSNAIKASAAELNEDRFAALNITGAADDDIFVVLDMAPTPDPELSSGAPRQRRATLPVWMDGPVSPSTPFDLDDDYAWPFAEVDEDLHWLGEHFRANLV